MLDADFEVKLNDTVLRELYRQIFWLQTNRTPQFAAKFESAFWQMVASLSAQPQRWQKIVVRGRTVHRAVLMQKLVLLYNVFPSEKRVAVIAMRGAAEDWTNQALPQ